MKIAPCIELYGVHGPDPWSEDWGICLPLEHVICRNVDGTPHTVGEFVWPWTAYTKNKMRALLYFYYWSKKPGTKTIDTVEITPEREARMRELQFLMTRVIYFGNENSTSTLQTKLHALHHIARFAEARSCTVRDVLTQTSLIDACGASLPAYYVARWMSWLTFLGQLDAETQLGFTLATPKRWKDLEQRAKQVRCNHRQHAPLPTRIYAAVINNLSTELDDIEAHTPRLLAALREGLVEYEQAKAAQTTNDISIGPALIEKHGLADYLCRHGFAGEHLLRNLAGTVSEIFQVCKLQIHAFSGIRHNEARSLPYHCIVSEKGRHGRTHHLIAGATTKFNKGRRLRTHWVTTERDGFRAIRLAQEFAAVIYETLGVTPSKVDDMKDEYPLFPSTSYLPWMWLAGLSEKHIQASAQRIHKAKSSLLSRLCPIIEEGDIAELEDIDPFRAWREESEFAIGQTWPLSTHQLRRSLAMYANASGLVRISSLRRQLQHLTREMALYYGRGSTFCKNFIEEDPKGFKRHIAIEWQDGSEEAQALAFVREVLNSKEPMFGGAGNFYQRQRERGEVMSREEVEKQVKAGLLAYTGGPLGGCTNTKPCKSKKGLKLIDIACATNHCERLIGKHSKIVQTIHFKRASMAHIAPDSITYAMEQEELASLERVELDWRPQAGAAARVQEAARG